MFAQILAWLFPPRLPRRLEDWPEPVKWEIHEQGWAGNVQKHYRDGIERHWAEYDALGPIQQRCLAGPQKKT